MKRFYLLLVLGAALTACQSSPATKDRQFKDSIARADGDKALGNIRFGVTMDEFETQQGQFLAEHNHELYGQYIDKIEGETTSDNQIYEVRIYSNDKEDHQWNELPFRDFLLAKYGMETERNVWVVGDRILSLKRHVFSEATKATLRRWSPGITDAEMRNPWYLRIVDKKLWEIHAQQIRAYEEERQQKAQELEKKNGDLKSL